MKVYAIRNSNGEVLSGRSRRSVYTRKADGVKAAEQYADTVSLVQVVEYTLGEEGGLVVHEFIHGVSRRCDYVPTRPVWSFPVSAEGSAE